MNPTCTHCGSENVLPFEDEEGHKSNTTFFIVLLTTVLIIAGYFLLMISSYLYFPAVLFIAIIVITRVINPRDKEENAGEPVEKDYMCLDCSGFFKYKGEHLDE